LALLSLLLPPRQATHATSIKQDLERLRDAALDSDYAYRQVAHLSNNIGPRLSGSAQAAHAVDYVARELRRLGLEVRLEQVMATHWVRGLESAELVSYPGQAPQTTQKIVVTTIGSSIATPPAGLIAPLVVVDDFAQLQSLGRARVEGKIVLFNAIFDQRMALLGFADEAYGLAVTYRRTGAIAAAKLGAVASLNRSVGGANYRLPHTGDLDYADGVTQIPSASIPSEDAELIAHLARQGEVKMRLLVTPQTLPLIESHNVIADIKGTEYPEKIVVVSGHLDSWDLGTGALDDGVGIAAAMEVGNLIQQLRLRPMATIRIIAYMDEEGGLSGALTYAKNEASRIGDHLAAIEMDLGAGHPSGFMAHVAPDALTRLQLLSDVLLRIGAPIIQRVDYSVGADISPLEGRGVPGFAPLSDARTYFNYHHTPADTLDKVVPRELAENAAVLAVLAYGLANLPLPRLATTGGN
ncbi:MAG: M28 family peptidase, partial [Acidobacteriota bacterium]